MAKDVITRFKLETTQYDSKLRDAAKNLSNFSKTATQAKEGFDKFTQSNVEAARALGSTAASSSNAKQRVQELVGAFNDAAKAYNNLTKVQQQSDFGRAMSQSLVQLQQRIKETKSEMQGLTGAGKSNGLLSGLGDKMSGAFQVFAGNMLTKAAGAVANLGNEMADMIKQGVELARQGEGVRIAFERLGRGDILDGLREATHGTVTDLELMKAAVKFNDFKLPLEELGTMLSFAQQKAKDTGQSVDYMVDSIVTGLGRKSLMILDNLGLSANEVKTKMEETGDMTKAVGAIIRDQMSKAGDYVETAADRATRADVDLKNAMEELGRTFQPLTDAGTNMWNSLKVGALDLLNNAVRPLINALSTAGRIRSKYTNQGYDDRVKFKLGRLEGIESNSERKKTYNAQLANYDATIKYYQQYLNDYKTWQSDNTAIAAFDRMSAFRKRTGLSMYSDVKEQLAVFKRARSEYVQGAKTILNDNPAPSPTDESGNDKKNRKSKITNKKTAPEVLPAGSVAELTKQMQELQKAQQLVTNTDDWKNYQAQIDAVKESIDKLKGITTVSDRFNTIMAAGGINPSDLNRQSVSDIAFGGVNLSTNISKRPSMQSNRESMTDVLNKISDTMSGTASSVGNIFSGVEQMGVDIPNEIKSVIGVVQGVATILTGISSLVTIIAGTSWLPFANGGVVHAASGVIVPGNHRSGDMVPAMLNSGEVVLNAAQTANLSSILQSGAGENLNLTATISGEQIRLALNNNSRRRGRGEYVTSNTIR
jgi:hypothetical protein